MPRPSSGAVPPLQPSVLLAVRIRRPVIPPGSMLRKCGSEPPSMGCNGSDSASITS